MNGNNTLQVVIEAVDKTQGTIREAQKGLEGFKERAESLRPTFQKMALVGTAAFGAVAGAVAYTTKAYQAQERAEARLEQIATQVTNATRKEIQGFKDLASELQRVGVVGDEVIIAGQSQIASFTKSAEVVSILSKDLADLSVATYGVNVSQEQSIQTANLLGKALQGQLGALTRTGILVSDEYKKAFEEANTEVERAAILSQIIQDNYGGLNEKMRSTSEGGMQAFKNAMGDVAEVMGENFAPILQDIAEKLVPIVERLGAWVQNNPELVKNIVLATGAIAGLVAVAGSLGLVLLALMPLIGPAGIVLAAIIAFTGTIYALNESIKILQNDWDLVWLGMKETAREATEWIMSKVFAPFEQQLRNIISLMEMVTSPGKTAINFGKSLASKITGVNDAIIAPSGNIITTNPRDYLIATTNPSGLMAGAGSNITINIDNFMGEREFAERMGDKIIRTIGLDRRL